MGSKFYSERNLKFLLYDVFKAEALTQFDMYQQHNKKIFDMVLDACGAMAKKLFRPYLEEMDRHHPELRDGEVAVHPIVPEIMKASGDGGWIGLRFPESLGGEQLPAIIGGACEYIYSAANYSAGVYAHLTAGAANLIASFGSNDLIETFVPRMLAGEWQGTMALTEPQAGSSLSDVATTATVVGNGTYRIKGQKVFISAGDHNGVENIVHLMLARIADAPPGVKGISLFVVPKMRLNDVGRLRPNDVTVTQVFHKLGYRGAPITELSMGDQGDCIGYLVGEPHRGLSYMFQMMNEARLGVGTGATGIATAAYYAALDYARERCQGRSLARKDPKQPQVPIIQHADVKRMLLFQRSVVEGSLSLLFQCYAYADYEKAMEGEQKERAGLLLEILTPIAKSYPSEMGILSTSQSLQCFGGYGYCDDFPVEQYYRDVRIHPIHEGTTGIQGLDLLGRKVRMEDGKALRCFIETVWETITEGLGCDHLSVNACQLKGGLEQLKFVTQLLESKFQTEGPEKVLADATLYLEFFSIIAIGWQWLKQALVADLKLKGNVSDKERFFFEGKIITCHYFFSYELPKIAPLIFRLCSEEKITVGMDIDHFND